MYFCLLISLLSGLLWLNMVITDFINAKINPYSTDENKDDGKNNAKIKIYLLIILAIFLSAVIVFFK